MTKKRQAKTQKPVTGPVRAPVADPDLFESRFNALAIRINTLAQRISGCESHISEIASTQGMGQEQVMAEITKLRICSEQMTKFLQNKEVDDCCEKLNGCVPTNTEN